MAQTLGEWLSVEIQARQYVMLNSTIGYASFVPRRVTRKTL
jgi:hypothetical protein